MARALLYLLVLNHVQHILNILSVFYYLHLTLKFEKYEHYVALSS